jgi:uncharacterized membrane protein
MTVYVLAFVIGVVAGLRSMTAFAAISWAAYFGWVNLGGSWLEFLGSIWTASILTLLALGELVTDQLPSTPSRTVPVQIGGRILVGAVAGAALGDPSHVWPMSALAGVVGAVAGTLVGKEFRMWLAGALAADRPAAFIEDAIAISFACLVVLAVNVSERYDAIIIGEGLPSPLLSASIRRYDAARSQTSQISPIDGK